MLYIQEILAGHKTNNSLDQDTDFTMNIASSPLQRESGWSFCGAQPIFSTFCHFFSRRPFFIVIAI